VSRIYDMQLDTLLVAHGGQVDFSQKAFEHLLMSAPRRPVTHWRVTKIKTKKLLLSIWKFGFQAHGKSKK
ncbi:Zn-dependent hydrolase, partial [Vibrio sp. 10N.261.45.A7]